MKNQQLQRIGGMFSGISHANFSTWLLGKLNKN